MDTSTSRAVRAPAPPEGALPSEAGPVVMLTLGQLAQIGRLQHLCQVLGWKVQLKRSAEPPHEVDELVYFCEGGLWLDVLRVRSDTDAQAARLLRQSVVDNRPRAVWEAEGTLAEVLDRLTELR